LAAIVFAALGSIAGAAFAARDLAGELAGAQASLAAGDYAKAYQAYLEHGKDNPLAQFSLGLFHEHGWGMPVDRAEACRWQEKAALGGIPAAQELLADCLRLGAHKPVDLAAAAHWYERAAASGIAVAQCSLAELYMAGQGVAKDPGKALGLCLAVANKGLAVAQLRLGRLYLEGDPGVRDPAAAARWLQTAAQAGNAEAQYRFGLMLRDGAGIAADVGAARWWLETAAGQGWLPAYLPTAELYLRAPADPDTGLLPAADLAKAYLWSAAALRRLNAPDDAAKARATLAGVTARMPETWRPDLDRRVSEHLAGLGGGAASLSATRPP
jgi:TPR repeat protein